MFFQFLGSFNLSLLAPINQIQNFSEMLKKIFRINSERFLIYWKVAKSIWT